MIHDLTPYPAYKDSGVPWLGEVPAHWEVRRLKRIAKLNPTKSESANTLTNGGLATFLPMERVSADGRIDAHEVRPIAALWNGFTYFRRADVIVAKITPCFENGKGACLDCLPTDIGFGSTEFHVLRASASILSKFLYRVTTLSEFRRLGAEAMTGAAGQQRVPESFVGDFQIGVPSLAEQSAIVRFLDHADRRIRRSIRAKQRLIALLNEQKQAIIHQAVTRGLDPTVRLKPSGVEWLGEVPEHWEVGSLRRWWTVTDCKHLTVPFVVEGIPLASVREVQSFDLSLANAKQTSPEWYETLIQGGRTPRPGDLIYCRNVSVGAAAFVSTDRRFAMGQDVCLIRSADQNQRYLNYFLHGSAMKHQLAFLLVGSTFNRINVADIKGLTIIVPPRDVQDAIVEYLDGALASIDRSIEDIRREITILREYRTRLIADVVTGKLDVRAAAGWPEEAEEPEVVEEADALAEGDEEGEGADLDAAPEEAET